MNNLVSLRRLIPWDILLMLGCGVEMFCFQQWPLLRGNSGEQNQTGKCVEGETKGAIRDQGGEGGAEEGEGERGGLGQESPRPVAGLQGWAHRGHGRGCHQLLLELFSGGRKITMQVLKWRKITCEMNLHFKLFLVFGFQVLYAN